MVSTSIRYTRPLSIAQLGLAITEKDDIFALGTVLWEISAGTRLYLDKSDREIRELFHKQDFPILEPLAANVRMVIEKCWKDHYSNAEEILLDLSMVILSSSLGDLLADSFSTGIEPVIDQNGQLPYRYISLSLAALLFLYLGHICLD